MSFSSLDAFNIEEYYKILCPEFPEFLKKYLELPILLRLKKIGLLCGTDWTALFQNNFFYSRFDHSVGVALVIWNFTHSKEQTLSGLFHDVSTPAFSHVTDFRKGDALTQSVTEGINAKMILEDKALGVLLLSDGLKAAQISDYHIFPIADNEIPRLSADRLEYMFPSGMALSGIWNLEEVKNQYENIVLCKNEDGFLELGFLDKLCALEYCKKFIEVGLILQTNRDKIAMQLLADILNKAIAIKIISEDDLYILGEKEIILLFDNFVKNTASRNITEDEKDFILHYKTFRNQNKVINSEKIIDDCYCVNLDVKKRYINPLVVTGKKLNGFYNAKRITSVLDEATRLVQDFMNFKDAKYGCLPFLH